MTQIEEMIKNIAKAASPIDETAIQISCPGQGEQDTPITNYEFRAIVKGHSIRAEYFKLSVAIGSGTEALSREVVVLLQSHCCYAHRQKPGCPYGVAGTLVLPWSSSSTARQVQGSRYLPAPGKAVEPNYLDS